MPRHVGMYRRSELIRLAGIPSDTVLQVAAERRRVAKCESGQHRQETDAQSGNEVCGRCGVVIDDYADVAAAGLLPRDNATTPSEAREGL